jgi:hypothetical protein
MASPLLIVPTPIQVGVDRVLHEMHRALPKERVDSTGMAAAQSAKGISLVTARVVARQALGGLAVAKIERAAFRRIRGARAWAGRPDTEDVEG